VTQHVRTMHDIVFDEDRSWSWLQEEDGNTGCNSNFIVEYLVEAAEEFAPSLGGDPIPSSTSPTPTTPPGMSLSILSSILSTFGGEATPRLLPRLPLLRLVQLRVLWKVFRVLLVQLRVLWRAFRVLLVRLRVLWRALRVLLRLLRVLIRLQALLQVLPQPTTAMTHVSTMTTMMLHCAIAQWKIFSVSRTQALSK
jgi:hypothetical protein